MQNQDHPATQGGIVQQQVYIDPATNCLFTVDPTTGQYLWLIDPSTGQPMVNPAMTQAYRPNVNQPASELSESVPVQPEPSQSHLQPKMPSPKEFAEVPKKKPRGKAPIVAGALAAVAVMAVVAVLLFVAPGALGGPAAQQSTQSNAPQQPVQSPDTAEVPPSEQSLASVQLPDDTESMPVGQAAEVENGLSVTLNSVDNTLTNYDGSPMTCINVTYANTGSKDQQYNVFDWKAQDETGVLRSFAFYSKATEDLNSGTLAPGESVSGNVYFEGSNLVKAYYFRSIVQTETEVVWSIR